MALLASKEEQVGTKCGSLWFWHQDAARVIFCFPWEVEGDWSSALGEWVERVLENEERRQAGENRHGNEQVEGEWIPEA